MAYSPEVASFCKDPKNPFEVKGELIVRKKLEIQTDWQYEISRNGEKYETDLIMRKYIEHVSYEIGKIEVEISQQWEFGQWPSFWKTYSFLRRKCERWEKGSNPTVWLDDPWGYANKTIYLICSKYQEDCFAALISDIWESDKKWLADSRIGKTEDRRHCFRFQKPPETRENKSTDIIARGWDDVMQLILTKLDKIPHQYGTQTELF